MEGSRARRRGGAGRAGRRDRPPAPAPPRAPRAPVDVEPEALLAEFGLTAFRPGQREAVAAALAGRDSLVVMPTGGGKSLCYQLPGIASPDLTVIVSPLIALMEDQCRRLTELGHPAVMLASGAREPRRAGRDPRRRRADRLRRAGAVRLGRLPRRAGPPHDRAVRRRRGALRERVGPRLPAGLPAPAAVIDALGPRR